MTRDEMMNEIRRLPLDEKLLLLEALERTVREELIPTIVLEKSRASLLVSEDEVPPFDELRGVLATEDAWKDDYADYLMKKYA